MKRIRVILALGLAPVAWLACGSVPAADCRPNLVIILADQQSPHVLGCAGDRVVRTPHLDRLAAGGVRFTATYCGSPLCVPSRMTFLTARHCSPIGVWSNGCLLDSQTPTFPGALAAAGYETVLAGRMHFAGPDQRHGFTRRKIGDVGQPRLAGGGTPSLLGSIVCTDTRTISFQAVPGGRTIDWEVALHASHGDVTFRDDKQYRQFAARPSSN
jgi:arylsulfatase A-like enzyme